MSEYILAQENGRTIPTEDTIFAVSGRANAMIAEKGKDRVCNATVGMLLDDQGELLVLSSVDKVFHELTPEEYAPYAPIGGTPGFRKAVIQAALKNYQPKGYVRAVASPGGTGSIRLAVGNYTQRGDKILVADWHWGPYGKIADELGRGTATFRLFDKAGKFNTEDFKAVVEELLKKQDSLLMILNTPAQNPTGYCMTDEEWKEVIGILSSQPKEKKIALLVDTAYIDFAGDEDKARSFLPFLEELPENVKPMLAFSLSKTFTLYGMRCGALIGFSKTEEEAEEFVRVCEFSARASWSNSPRVGQSIIERIFADKNLLDKVTAERAEIRDMLLARGRAFEEAAKEAGLTIMPFDGGFFAVIPCDDPKSLGREMEKEGIFIIPFGDGLRVSLAAIPIDQCRMIPAKVKAVMDTQR